jgi:hypothetical protein
MPPFSHEIYGAAREEELASGNEGQFFSLIYNEQHAPAIDWFTGHGWHGTAIELPDFCREIARPVPEPTSRGCAHVRQYLPGQRRKGVIG